MSIDIDRLPFDGMMCFQHFDENRWNECGAGIHFFITRAEAY